MTQLNKRHWQGRRPFAERGAALLVTMVLMVVITLLAAYAAATVGFDLRMVRNFQESVRSLNSAEGGSAVLIRTIFATPATLQGFDNRQPLGITPAATTADVCATVRNTPNHPLRDVCARADDLLRLDVFLVRREGACPRTEQGTSARAIQCDHYRFESEHTSDAARTQINQGAFAEVIGRSSP